MENPMNMGEFNDELADLKAELASASEAEGKEYDPDQPESMQDYRSDKSEMEAGEDVDDYEVDVDEYIKTGEPVQKLPLDKRAGERAGSSYRYEDVWGDTGELKHEHELSRAGDDFEDSNYFACDRCGKNWTHQQAIDEFGAATYESKANEEKKYKRVDRYPDNSDEPMYVPADEDWDEAGYDAKYGGSRLDKHGQSNHDFEPQAGNCPDCGHPYDNHSTVDSICYGGGDGILGEGPLGGCPCGRAYPFVRKDWNQANQ
jgi:hypothetical protein